MLISTFTNTLLTLKVISDNIRAWANMNNNFNNLTLTKVNKYCRNVENIVENGCKYSVCCGQFCWVANGGMGA